jgi:hypothetical protein
VPVLETAVPDIRDSDVGHLNDEPSRIPTPAESEDAVAHARNVLREIEQRRALDERHAAEKHRFIQLNQWAADDRADATAAANVDALGRN